MPITKPKVIVGLSGGVDSSVSAYFLKKQGYEVIGAYLAMKEEGEKRENELQQVEKITKHLGIPLVVEDVSKDFQNLVTEYFVREYENNRTPNPCVFCNILVKFERLWKIAEKHKASFVATGHYARVETDEGKFLLKKGLDASKDQSYFLHRLTQKDLAHVLFPLGGMKKDEVKKIAGANNIPFIGKESQDACFFLKNQKLADYLAKRVELKPGKIVDDGGAVLGQHKGLQCYTQGQRFGLGLSGGPFYVVRKDLGKNRLLVSKNMNHELIMSKMVEIEDASWTGDLPQLGKIYTFKQRYQSTEAEGKFVRSDGNVWSVKFSKAQWAVAPGQSLVAYDGENVVGGGVIK